MWTEGVQGFDTLPSQSIIFLAHHVSDADHITATQELQHRLGALRRLSGQRSSPDKAPRSFAEAMAEWHRKRESYEDGGRVGGWLGTRGWGLLRGLGVGSWGSGFFMSRSGSNSFVSSWGVSPVNGHKVWRWQRWPWTLLGGEKSSFCWKMSCWGESSTIFGQNPHPSTNFGRLNPLIPWYYINIIYIYMDIYQLYHIISPFSWVNHQFDWLNHSTCIFFHG